MIPTPIAERWRPMWHPDAHPERPWWRAIHSQTAAGPLVRWQRGDGQETGSFRVPAMWGEHDDPGALYRVTPLSDLALIDRDHPLPRPSLMPGQVWIDPDGNEVLITIGDTRPVAPEDERDYRNGVIIGASTLDRCILVAGPSPWGRDVPWMDTRGTP